MGAVRGGPQRRRRTAASPRGPLALAATPAPSFAALLSSTFPPSSSPPLGGKLPSYRFTCPPPPSPPSRPRQGLHPLLRSAGPPPTRSPMGLRGGPSTSAPPPPFGFHLAFRRPPAPPPRGSVGAGSFERLPSIPGRGGSRHSSWVHVAHSSSCSRAAKPTPRHPTPSRVLAPTFIDPHGVAAPRPCTPGVRAQRRGAVHCLPGAAMPPPLAPGFIPSS